MRRFFGPGEPEPPRDPAPPAAEASDLGEVQLTPARRLKSGPAEPRDLPRRPLEPATTPGATGFEARLDILLSVTRSFRDTVSDRLDAFGDRLDAMDETLTRDRADASAAMSDLSQSVTALTSSFSQLSGELAGLANRMAVVLGQLAELDLRGTADSLGTGIEELRREVARGDGQLDDMRRHVEGQLAGLLDRLRADIDETLGATNGAMARVEGELVQLRRRMALTARERPSEPPPQGKPRRR